MFKHFDPLSRIGFAACFAATSLWPLASFAASPPVSISDSWFRYITPQVPAGGYMMLQNESKQPAIMLGAASPACGMLMLHRSETQGGADRMMAVDKVVVPPGKSVAFSPGGYHLMCMQPRMKPGQSVNVTLKFEGGGTLSAPFAVFGPAGRPARKSASQLTSKPKA